MKISEIISRLNKKFPEYIQESYDNTGSQIIFGDESIKKIYICLDPDFNTINDANLKGCNLIICHHPLIFKPVKKILSNESKSRVLLEVIKFEISVYSIHTNLDKMMYKALSDFLGYQKSSPLIKGFDLEGIETGYGSYIILENEIIFSDILSNTKKRLESDFIIYSGDLNKQIKTIAFINGSGGGSIEKIIGIYNPDCIITGDVNYHHVKFAIDNGTAIIDAGHFGTEYIFKKLLAESLKEILYDESIEIIISDVEKNPFKVYI